MSDVVVPDDDEEEKDEEPDDDVSGPGGDPSSSSDSDQEDDSEDDDSGGSDGRRPEKRKRDSDAETEKPAPPEEPKPSRSSASRMREYLHAALPPSVFFSVVTPAVHDVPGEINVFQLIEKEARHKQVELFGESAVETLGLYTVTVQPFNRWGPPVGAMSELKQLDAFILKEPEKVDILSLIGVSPASRENVRVWSPTSGEMALEGCVHLVDPQPMKVDMQMSNKKFPLLCLEDALQNAGFIGVEKHVVHSPKLSFVKTFDSRARSFHSAYARCVLAQSALFEKDVAAFPSGELQKFYELMLRAPSKAIPGQRDTVYADLLQKEEGGYGVSIEACLREVDFAPQFPSLRRRARSRSDSMGGESLKSDVNESNSGSGYSNSSSSSSSSSSGKSSMCGESDDDAQPLPEQFPKVLFGENVKRKWSTGPGGERFLSLEVSCPNAAHRIGGGCTSSRRVNIDVDVFGKDAAVHFLGTWLLCAFERPKERHHRWRPGRAAIREHIATYYSERG